MEHVAGEDIMGYAARENLDLEARLNLFREVCSAVAFAHRNLVIHRDLKPSNILVTPDGTTKLLDFGIAKLLRTESDGETATRSFIFTPEYASPEQVRGEKLTTATDVYSLGVILYELLTGSRPYKNDSRNIGDIIRAVCETDPERPSFVISRSAQMEDGNLTGKNNGQRTNDELQRTNPKSKIRNPKSLRGDLDNIHLKSITQRTRTPLFVGRTIRRRRAPSSCRSAGRGAKRYLELSRRKIHLAQPRDGRFRRARCFSSDRRRNRHDVAINSRRTGTRRRRNGTTPRRASF
jgi:serine/threonine protein kinase